MSEFLTTFPMKREVEGNGAEDEILDVDVDSVVCPEVLEGAHCR